MTKSLSLFDSDGQPEVLNLRDADVRFLPHFYDEDEAARHFTALSTEIPWRQEAITLWGKKHQQPRLTAWYGDAGTDYSYSGLAMAPLPWSQRILAIKHAIEALCGWHFNSVLANLYRDERDSVGWHADDEPELGNDPLIASLSLGETRTFKLKHKTQKSEKPLALELNSGSLLLMGKGTQRHWTHAVDKERHARGPRINLTFRLVRPGPA